MRITTALIQLLFFVSLLMQPAESVKQRFKTALPFLFATVVLLIWPVWIIANAPQAFFLNIYRIPVLYGKWLHEIGMAYNKIALILNCVTRPGYLVLLIMMVYLYIVVVRHRHKIVISDRVSLLLTALLPITFFVIAVIPPTIWHQYLAMPVPFVIISLAYLLFYLRSSKFGVRCSMFRISCALLAVCSVVAVVSHRIALYRMPMLLVPEYWVPIQIHNISEDIAQDTRETRLVLTLAPIFALESGCDIYTELSAGAIVYRIADRLSTQNRDITHTVGPGTLKKMIVRSPPSAVILGVEMESLEEPLFKTLIQPNEEKWERKVYENGPIVYFRR
jgi:hypothetical protein